MPAGTPLAKASLFVTCLVDQFYPEVGESTVRVLRHLGVDLDFKRIRFTLKFVPKARNVIGTQVADLAAYPIARRVLTGTPGPAYEVIRPKFARRLKIFPT